MSSTAIRLEDLYDSEQGVYCILLVIFGVDEGQLGCNFLNEKRYVSIDLVIL